MKDPFRTSGPRKASPRAGEVGSSFDELGSSVRSAAGKVAKLFKDASNEQEVAAGRRKPKSTANPHLLTRLQKKGAEKQELQEIQSKLSDLC
jgi:hypothetical protein